MADAIDSCSQSHFRRAALAEYVEAINRISSVGVLQDHPRDAEIDARTLSALDELRDQKLLADMEPSRFWDVNVKTVTSCYVIHAYAIELYPVSCICACFVFLHGGLGFSKKSYEKQSSILQIKIPRQYWKSKKLKQGVLVNSLFWAAVCMLNHSSEGSFRRVLMDI